MISTIFHTCVKQAFLMACLIVLAASMPGCRDNPVVALSDDNRILQPTRDHVLVANPQSPLPDVPAPIGFELIANRSSGRINPGGTRDVLHVYQGIGDFSAAVEYYRRQALAHGWQNDFQQAGPKETVLSYRSQRETLEIRLTKPGRILTVTVTIRSREFGATM